MRKNLLLIAGLLLVMSACKPAKQSTKKKPATTPGTETAKAGISSKTKDCIKLDGLFPIYQDTLKGKAYLAIHANQLDKEYIYFSYTENGVLAAGHNRGSYRDNMVFSIRRNYGSIEFVKENTSFYFDSTTALFKSREANISPSILVSEEIIVSEKDTLFLISADKIFLTEAISRIKPPSFPGAGGGFRFTLGNLSSSKTRYRSIKNYPSNTDLVVEYVFDNPSAFISGGAEVTDPRSVSIVYQHSLIAMPENNGYEPRRDDPRVGFFTSQVNDMTTLSATPYRDVIHRWNLIKKNPEAELSEPVKPIVWWIENTTPVEYRETIREAALTWNVAFEKAGFKNAIEVQIQPDDADWDAGDINYNVLRWTSSPNPPFGGYGPSFVNPRTGEILGADIMLEFVFLTNRLRQFDSYTTAGLGLMGGEEADEQVPHIHNGHACHAGDLLHHNTLLGMTQLTAIEANDIEKERFIKSAIYYLILHEMGHTLGMMHNMKASNLWMPNDIHNPEKTGKTGLIGSVMDYPAVNINPKQGGVQGDYYTSQPGPYDLWAIEYAYSPSLNDPVQEEARLSKILARSTEPELTFGNDADDMRSPGKGIDPRVMIFDISGDAVQYSYDRINMLNRIIPKLKEKYSTEGEGYQQLLVSYLTITGEIGNATSVMSRYIGGVYVERSVVGQPNAKTPYTPVPFDMQKKAMRYLSEQLFAPDAFKSSEGLYQHLQRQRRGFNFFVNTEDPKITDRVLQMQKNVLQHILHQNTLERVTNTGLYGNKYAVVDIMSDLENAIFAADWAKDVNTFRVNAQKLYVDYLLAIVGTKQNSSYNAESKAAAYATLVSIQKKLKQYGTAGNLTTRSHRAYLYYLIESGLKA